MNGLKFIRTRCNYSQNALAKELGVSRQAVNMWENSVKAIPPKRKQELSEFFGITNTDWFDEIDMELADKIYNAPMYKTTDETSEHWLFKPTEHKYGKHATRLTNDEISLDEKCALKRIEFKELISEIQSFTEEVETHNSYEFIVRMNHTLKLLTGILEAAKASFEAKSGEKMIYLRTLEAVIDSVNYAFGVIEKEDYLAFNNGFSELNNCSDLTSDISEMIKKHLTDRIEKTKQAAADAKKHHK